MANSSMSGGLNNPAMAYQPLTPPGGGIAYDSDSENGHRRYKLSIRLSTVVRFLVLAFAIAAVGIWGRLGVHKLYSADIIFVFVELLLVIIWNVSLLGSRFLRSKSLARMLPSIVCQVGDCSCILNGDEDELGELRHKMPAGRPRQNWKSIAVMLVDFVLGLTIMILTATSWSHIPYGSSWAWHERQLSAALLGLIIVVCILELALVTASLLPFFRNLVFEFGIVWSDPDDGGRVARIRLPSDTEDRRTAAGSVSVTA